MNMAKKVTLVSREGVAFEVDTEVVISQSRFLKKVIEDVGTDAPIPLPNLSSGTLSMIRLFCEVRFACPLSGFLVDPDNVLSDVQNNLELPGYAEQSEQEDMKSGWGVKENDAKFLNEVCTANLKTIKDLHEAAKYLDMPNLVYLTEAFLKEGVRPFMDVLLPWENFSSVREHRGPAVRVF